MSGGHTPGAWHVLDHQTAGPTIVVDRDLKHIADCDFTWWAPAQNAANARLIAAAPELLEALERCENFIANTEGELGIELECGEIARAAIAKARGEA